jgi:NADH dehydrogenase FAD-containing subunit
VPDRKTDTYYPPPAQHALREGKALAHNIATTLRGGQKKPFILRLWGNWPPLAGARGSPIS